MKGSSNSSVTSFVKFLERTLIPDLKDLGMSATAKDMQHAVKFISGAQRVAGRGRKEFLDYIEMVENDLRDADKYCTAQDYFTARMFIYWDR